MKTQLLTGLATVCLFAVTLTFAKAPQINIVALNHTSIADTMPSSTTDSTGMYNNNGDTSTSKSRTGNNNNNQTSSDTTSKPPKL